MLGYFLAPRVALGVGAFEQLSALGSHRSWLLVDPALAELPKVRLIEEELVKEGGTVVRWLAPPGEPTPGGLEQARASITSVQPDWVVAVGGGSVLDLAKWAWLAYERPDLPLAGGGPTEELGLRQRARFVAVPTTCGSGSESTGTAYLWDGEGGGRTVSSRELVADWVVLDPELLRSLPARWVASTAADALAHGLEALLSEWANPLSSAMAREAVGTILRELPKAVRHPETEEPRLQLQVAATLAGLAVANSQLGLVHALAHALGPRLGLAHSVAVAALVPYGAEFNFGAGRDRLATLERTLGAGPLQSGHALAERLRLLWESVALPRTLGAAGVTPERLGRHREAILTDALRSPALLSNPRVPTRQELERLLDAAMTGGPVPP
ncbi:MAG: iron-containing alcohol dehydrogenase [Thermoplasmata archaeon]|nr:iron-containing alcohol dehydrogenase [Thermoplasmata archaeon]